MAIQHKTARGAAVDMDRLRLANEKTIAVGNMKVNARGDQLGPGGKVIKTRSQILAEKNKIHGSLADDQPIRSSIQSESHFDNVYVEPIIESIEDSQEPEIVSSEYTKPRGSFAESVAKETNVTQELLDPREVHQTPANQPGIKRI